MHIKRKKVPAQRDLEVFSSMATQGVFAATSRDQNFGTRRHWRRGEWARLDYIAARGTITTENYDTREPALKPGGAHRPHLDVQAMHVVGEHSSRSTRASSIQVGQGQLPGRGGHDSVWRASGDAGEDANEAEDPRGGGDEDDEGEGVRAEAR